MDKRFNLREGMQRGVSPLCDFFALFSARTWQELELVRNGVFRMNETTITQNLVKHFWIESNIFRLPITIYESNNEKANGNDLEILVETNLGYLMLPVQVKVIKDNDRYTGISHIVRGRQQIDLLIEYANKKQGIPAYIFYNYFDGYELSEYIESFKLTSPQDFGCTIGIAQYLRKTFFERGGVNKWHIPSFTDLHLPIRSVIPIHWAFQRLASGGIDEIKWFIGPLYNSVQLHFYSRAELTEDGFGTELISPGQISGINDVPEMGDIVAYEDVVRTRTEFKGDANAFTPRYRIVISKLRETRKLYRLS